MEKVFSRHLICSFYYRYNDSYLKKKVQQKVRIPNIDSYNVVQFDKNLYLVSVDNNMERVLIIIFACVILSVYSEIVQHYPCDSEVSINSNNLDEQNAPDSWECVVQEVRVSPCPVAQEDRSLRCNIKRGSVMKIEFDYTPANNLSIEHEIQRVGTNRGYFSWHNWFTFFSNPVEQYNFNVTVDKSTLPVSTHLLLKS